MKYIRLKDANTQQDVLINLDQITSVQQQSVGYSKISYLNGQHVIVQKTVGEMDNILSDANHTKVKQETTSKVKK